LPKKLKKKQKLIEFVPWKSELEGVFDPPVPASSLLPAWYQRQGMYADGNRSISDKGDFNHTVKACMPALDAMTAGYLIPLPQDLNVVINPDGSHGYQWPSDIFAQVGSHSLDQVSEMPIDRSVWSAEAMKFNNPWVLRTPPGYSTLFVHPMWRDELPFRSLPGVVDTDRYNFNPVNFPFLIRNNFSGIIEAGTPIIQAIPFKRIAFESTVWTEHDPSSEKMWQKTRKTFGHRYKRNFRQKKEYK